MGRPTRLPLLAGLALELAALAGLARLGDAGGRVPTALFLLAVAALGFLLAVRVTHRPTGTAAILGVALLLRAPLLPAEPSLSDDVWRYLHDGRTQRAGVSPFAFAPADPETLPFRGPDHDRINNPHLVTIYPPFAQIAFLTATFLPGSPLHAWKLLLLLADLAVILLLIRLLRARGDPPAGAVLYAWNPLVVVEVALGAHLEPIAIAPLLAALLLAHRVRPAASGAAIGLSIAAKYFALPLVPFLARGHARRVVAGAVAAGTVVALPYVLAGPDIFGSLFVFGKTWASNAGAFALLARLPGVWTGRLVAAAVLLALLVLLWRRRVPAAEAAFAFIFATLLLSPVVHPWYLLWLVALVPVARVHAHTARAALFWSLTVPLAYLAIPAFRANGVWNVPLGARLVQYLPVAALLLLAALTRRTAARRSATSSAVP